MSIPEGYVLVLIVAAIFIIASILKIKEGQEGSKNPVRIIRWISKFRVISATIILLWVSFILIIIVVAIIIFSN